MTTNENIQRLAQLRMMEKCLDAVSLTYFADHHIRTRAEAMLVGAIRDPSKFDGKVDGSYGVARTPDGGVALVILNPQGKSETVLPLSDNWVSLLDDKSLHQLPPLTARQIKEGAPKPTAQFAEWRAMQESLSTTKQEAIKKPLASREKPSGPTATIINFPRRKT